MTIKVSGILIKDRHENFLVVHRRPDVPNPNKWGIPAGKIGDGKTPIETALLKTKQEVGISFSPTDLVELPTQRYVIGEDSFIFYTFYHQLKIFRPKVRLNTDGLDNFCWERAETLLDKYDLLPNMPPILGYFGHDRPLDTKFSTRKS